MSADLFSIDLITAITPVFSAWVAVGIGLAVISFLLGYVIWWIIDLMKGGLV